MRVLQINNLCGRGSTGKIAVGISKLSDDNGIENTIFYFSRKSPYPNSTKITNRFSLKIQALKSRILGNYGFNSNRITNKLIKKIDEYNPDIVHIHNIHGHNANIEVLFEYLKATKKKVVYTFHDCWAFTGYCPHFSLIRCEKWKTKCFCCPLRKKYSWFIDKSDDNFERKKRAILGTNMVIVTPSFWLRDITRESFLNIFPIKVINNGIDLNVFHPQNSSFRKDYELENKKIILGVADIWSKQKGLDVFIELSKKMPAEYKVVLVGTSKKIDKKLPSSILSIHRTQNQKELAGIYSSADVFVNATREDSFPTVNMESLACGTPVLTFRTGGSPEIIDDACGSVVECDDIDSLISEIIRICTLNPYSKESCLNKAKNFNANDRFKEYIDLYKTFFED